MTELERRAQTEAKGREIADELREYMTQAARLAEQAGGDNDALIQAALRAGDWKVNRMMRQRPQDEDFIESAAHDICADLIQRLEAASEADGNGKERQHDG